MAPYLPDELMRLRPDVPTTGLCAEDDDRPCRIGVHHYRDRTTGPCFPLMVAQCRVHAKAFTVYPPGYTAYSQQILLPIGLDGGDVAMSAVADALAPVADQPPPVAGVAPPDPTRFGDSRRAAAGQPGVRQADHGSSFWWGSQRRRIAWGTTLCGTEPNLADNDRHARALALGVPAQVLMDAAAAIAARPGYRSRGQSVVAVTDAVVGPSALERLRHLLAAGHQAGLWGPPYWWDRGSRSLRRWAFPEAGTRPP